VIRRDAVGNRLDDGIRQYQYNAMNRLAQLSSSQTQIQATYSYNFIGERVRKQLAGAQAADIRYIYGQGGELLGEYDSDGNVIREYIYFGNGAVKQLIAQVEADGSIVTIHSDHLTTPRLATKEDQTIVWRWSSDAFGTTAADEDPDGDGNQVVVNHRFPGQYYDAESDLHYNLHRYYDPVTGRYITSDPIGLAGGLNTFGYVGASPLNSSDPSGLFPCGGACVGAIYAVIKVVAAIYDAYDTADTITDDCASTGEKVLAGGMYVAGALSPVPGLGIVNDVVGAAKKLPIPSSGEKVYRVYGGDSMPGGASWSPVNPANVNNYRDAAGLPSGGDSSFKNSGRFVIEATLQDPSKVVKVQTATPLDGFKGGIPEYIIPDALSNGAVKVNHVRGVNPEF
jgi:RHS repeat-associated protein